MMNKEAHGISMSGATGFVGSYLTGVFKEKKWPVIALGRKDFTSAPEELAAKMEGTDVVVNLSGAPITGRWTEEYKKVMYDSRVSVTKKLVSASLLMKKRPSLLISTSAIGYYASGSMVHTEEKHEKADDFLGHLAEDWEKEALKAADGGIRTVIFRFGVVLGKDGGALQKMITPFKLGLGGTIGDGSQAFSWIHINDLISAYKRAMEDTHFEGVYNLSSPKPTTNKGLTQALGKALGRPTLLRVPQFLLRMQMGEGAGVLTTGQRVIPEKLLAQGFTFEFSDIETAVRDCLS